MLSSPEIKLLRSLSIKKYRQKTGLFLIEGYRLLKECLDANYSIGQVWMDETFEKSEYSTELKILMKQKKVDFRITTARSIKQVTETQHNQGCIATIFLPKKPTVTELSDRILILDKISDPGNLGTLLRTAEWFGLHLVVLSQDSVDPFNPKVVRAGMGAHFYLKIQQIDIRQFLLDLCDKGFLIFGGVMDGQSLEDIPTVISEKWALVLGNEAFGLDKNIESCLTNPVTIKKTGNIESLNVSVAGGIILSALCK